MSIELAVAAAAFLVWCLASAVWKSLPGTSGSDARLIWREDSLHSWHEVAEDAIPPEVRADLHWNVDDRAYASLLDVVLSQRPPGTATVQFAVVLTSGEKPTDVLFVSDVHPVSAKHHSAVAAAPLLIERRRKRGAVA